MVLSCISARAGEGDGASLESTGGVVADTPDEEAVRLQTQGDTEATATAKALEAAATVHVIDSFATTVVEVEDFDVAADAPVEDGPAEGSNLQGDVDEVNQVTEGADDVGDLGAAEAPPAIDAALQSGGIADEDQGQESGALPESGAADGIGDDSVAADVPLDDGGDVEEATAAEGDGVPEEPQTDAAEGAVAEEADAEVDAGLAEGSQPDAMLDGSPDNAPVEPNQDEEVAQTDPVAAAVGVEGETDDSQLQQQQDGQTEGAPVEAQAQDVDSMPKDMAPEALAIELIEEEDATKELEDPGTDTADMDVSVSVDVSVTLPDGLARALEQPQGGEEINGSGEVENEVADEGAGVMGIEAEDGNDEDGVNGGLDEEEGVEDRNNEAGAGGGIVEEEGEEDGGDEDGADAAIDEEDGEDAGNDGVIVEEDGNDEDGDVDEEAIGNVDNAEENSKGEGADEGAVPPPVMAEVPPAIAFSAIKAATPAPTTAPTAEPVTFPPAVFVKAPRISLLGPGCESPRALLHSLTPY